MDIHYFLLITGDFSSSPSIAVKRVKGFKLHPDYNITAKVKEGVKEFYDYDVALVQLEEDVKISAIAR